MEAMKIKGLNLKKRLKTLLRRPYYVYREIIKRDADRKRLWNEAVEKYRLEQPSNGSLVDYKRALRRQRVSYDEYMKCYEFWNLKESERDEFISEMEMRCIYRKTVQVEFDRLCCNKAMIYRAFYKFVHRRWAYVMNLSFEEFKEFIAYSDCIGKPAYGTLGRGVFLICKDEKGDGRTLYEYCRKNDIIVEERVRACKEMEDFHPKSLNTIRVYTISKSGRCELVAAELRVGVGDSVIDNASAGGIVAAIDLETGIIIGDGADKAGNRYRAHPDTGKVFKGFVIPHWQKVVDTCKEMSAVVPEMVFGGWDICVLPNGNVEMMEVNSYPNVSGLQTAYRKGLKPRLSALGKEVLGYDPVKLISIWSKSYVKYERVYGRY